MSNPFKAFTCSFCGEKKNAKGSGDYEYMQKDPFDKTPVCESCFSEHYEENCQVCDNCMLKEDRGFVVFAETIEADHFNSKVKPGYYRILDFPLYVGPLIGSGSITSRNLSFVGPLTGKESKHIENGHVCFECVRDAGHLRPFSLAIFDGDGRMDRPALDTPNQYRLREAA